MSPEKEVLLVAAARRFEEQARKAAALREKRDKLADTLRDVQQQFESAAETARSAERELFDIVTGDLPALPTTYDARTSIAQLGEVGRIPQSIMSQMNPPGRIGGALGPISAAGQAAQRV